MEAAAGGSAARGASMPMPSSQPSRKEWRAVSEHPVRNAGAEDVERSKLGQSDERTIYEVQQGGEPVDVDFCSIDMNGSLDTDVMQQRIHGVARQREELQQMEIELRAQLIARSEVMEMQNSFDTQMEEHVNAKVKLQEQLHERDNTILELERKIEEKERELHAIKLDSEAAWAKEDLLREQKKELATFRRELDNFDAERAQHLKQIRDLQEHIQDKERQFMEMQEQHRAAQETILIKDEQLREAQAWIRRVQEMDALQSTTNQSLHTELRERTEQYNQLWLGCQRQFSEMERVYMHTIQQLQLELADVRERSGIYPDESRIASSKDVSQFGQSNGSHSDMNGSGTPGGNSVVFPNENTENVSSLVSTGDASTQTNHVPGVPITPSLLGMAAYLPPGQATALHPFVMHQPGVTHPIPSHITQPHVGHFHSVPAISSHQHWQNQQAVSEGSEVPTQNHYPPSEAEQNLLRSDTNYNYEVSVNGETLRPDYLGVHVSQGVEPGSVIPSSAEEGQVLEPMDKSYLVATEPQQSLQHLSSQFRDALKLDPLVQSSETKENLTNHQLEGQGLTIERASSVVATPSSETPNHSVDFSKISVKNASVAVSPDAFVSSEQQDTNSTEKIPETTLLDERSLLACIVRTIPPGPSGKIRISSTLPNRLGKMLAPLHWHDYKKKYGKLDDFVASHPELFVIEGDYIQLREGAQEIIAAAAAAAKVAAAAAGSSPYSSLLPSVAVTPMAQSHRLKRASSNDSNPVKTEKTIFKERAVSTPANVTDNPLQLSAMQNHHSNGVSYSVTGGTSNIKILSKPKDPLELNGPEARLGKSSGPVALGNGANQNRAGLSGSQSKGLTHGKPSANFVGKQQGRTSAVSSTSRR